MHLNKRDLVTIAVLSIIFFSIATWNLGLTQTPVTTAQIFAGQSFTVDLGNATTVKSVFLLYKDGHFNLTVSVGTPNNWQVATTNHCYPWDSTNNDWSLDYYKWDEVGIQQTTQYLRLDFNQSISEALIAEIAVIDQANQTIPIVSISNAGSGSPNLANLVDEQDKVALPATYMGQTYFDEIYFVRTAEQYLHLQFPYEWTHPPLGKLLQAAGIAVFGFSPFGWRLMGVIFATLMIPIMYVFGKKLFGTWIGGFAPAFLLTFDFMHFSMARMGTAETYVVFFSLLSQLFFFVYFMNVLKSGWKTSVLPLFFAVIFFALGFSSKWIVLFGAVGMLSMLAALRIKELWKLKESIRAKYAAFFDHPFLLLVGFVGVAVVIYFATYIPDMIIGRPFIGTYGNGVVDLQFAMYHYHSTLPVTHGIAWDSPWWSWPFILTPLWLAGSSIFPNNTVSTIMLLGNPAVWWVGFACIILLTATVGENLLLRLRDKLTRKKQYSEQMLATSTEATAIDEAHPTAASQPTASPVRGWDMAAIFIITIFFFQWLPYILISRITYIYHFYIDVPFVCFASAYFLNKIWTRKYGKIVTVAYLAAVVAVFVLFYAPISGMPVLSSWIDSLKLFGRYWLRP